MATHLRPDRGTFRFVAVCVFAWATVCCSPSPARAQTDARQAPVDATRPSTLVRQVTGPKERLQRAVASGGATLEIRLVPVASHPDGPYGHGGAYSAADISGSTLVRLDGGFRSFWNLELANWDPDYDPNDGPESGIGLGGWQAVIDANGYSSGLGDPLAPATVSCFTHDECVSALGEPGAQCAGGACNFAWVNRTRPDAFRQEDPLACGNPTFGVTSDAAYGPHFFGSNDPEQPSEGFYCGLRDPGVPVYGGTMALDVPETAKGVYTLPFDPTRTNAHQRDQVLTDIPIAALVPGSVDIILGACCTDLAGDTTCTNELTNQECLDQPTADIHVFHPGNICAEITCCLCVEDSACNDFNACTFDTCNICICENTPSYDTETQCCDPATAETWTLPASSACTSRTCGDNPGEVITTFAPEGASCEGEDPCVQDAVCDGNGTCISDPYAGPECPKPRYITLDPQDTGGLTALRITLASLHDPQPPYAPGVPVADFSGFEGEHRWVGPVMDCPDSTTLGTSFKCARLQCTPEYVDWPAELAGEVLHVTGDAVVPSSLYEVAQLDINCQGNEDTCGTFVNEPDVATSRWGDVATEFQDPAAATPSQPNVLDLHTVVVRLKDLSWGVTKVRAQLDGNDPDPAASISVVDVSRVVDAIKGFGYPLPGPAPCGP